MELTYEGLQADLARSIDEQEAIVSEMREDLENTVQHTEGACHGEPYFAHEGQNYELAEDRLWRLRSLSEGLDEREARGLRLGHPRDDVFVDDLLRTMDA